MTFKSNACTEMNLQQEYIFFKITAWFLVLEMLEEVLLQSIYNQIILMKVPYMTKYFLKLYTYIHSLQS